MDPIQSAVHIEFLKAYSLYLRYNDFDEYSYQFTFSKKPLERFRYDNFDHKWSVSTSPHHFHPRSKKIAIESLMKGNPDLDMKRLIAFIQNNVNLD